MSVKEFTEIELDTNMHNYVLRTVTVKEAKRKTAYEIAEKIALSIGISVGNLTGRSRYRHIVQGRRELYILLREKGWSYPAIGAFVGRDHTTIIAAVKGK